MKKTSTERKPSPMLVGRGAVGVLPQAPAGTLSLHPARGNKTGRSPTLDPSAQLSWSLSHALPACLSAFILIPCKPHAHRRYTAAANTPSPNSHVPHGSSKSAAALPPDECAFPPAYRQYQSPRPPECSPPRRVSPSSSTPPPVHCRPLSAAVSPAPASIPVPSAPPSTPQSRGSGARSTGTPHERRAPCTPPASLPPQSRLIPAHCPCRYARP